MTRISEEEIDLTCGLIGGPEGFSLRVVTKTSSLGWLRPAGPSATILECLPNEAFEWAIEMKMSGAEMVCRRLANGRVFNRLSQNENTCFIS